METVCLLSKLHEAKHHVNVRLDMDELDITSAESKATYGASEVLVGRPFASALCKKNSFDNILKN